MGRRGGGGGESELGSVPVYSCEGSGLYAILLG